MALSRGPAIVRIWRYRVDAAQRAEFELRYGGDGDWVRLFRRADGFIGTQLLRDPLAPGVYVTLDRWRSSADFQAFRTQFGAEYAALDRACDALTSDEVDLGQYELIGRE
jgi:heme-degrading monooxygenase HmoA